MTTHSDEALSLAGHIHQQVWCERSADLVANAIRNASLDGCALDDDQATALFKALAEAGDGVLEQTALLIDFYWAHRLIRQAEDGP